MMTNFITSSFLAIKLEFWVKVVKLLVSDIVLIPGQGPQILQMQNHRLLDKIVD